MGRKACHLSDDESHAIRKLYMSCNNISVSKMLAIPGKTISNIKRTFKGTANTKKKPISGGKEKLSLTYLLRFFTFQVRIFLQHLKVKNRREKLNINISGGVNILQLIGRQSNKCYKQNKLNYSLFALILFYLG